MAVIIPLLIFGFVLLIKGADYLVEGSSSVAKKYGISSLVIGLTIVSFGTSAPEFLVSIMSSLRGSNQIVLGNILGSNIANICLILGVSSMIYGLRVTYSTVWREIPFLLLAVFVMTILANDVNIDGASFSALTRIDGLVMGFFFIIFIYYTYGIRSAGAPAIEEEVVTHTTKKSTLMIIGGMIGLAWGGQLVVDQAIKIANIFGVSEALIGLTIVAIGTSLPELATSAMAAYKKNADIAIGNVVGSNIFNTLWVLPFSSVIGTIEVPANMNFDFLIVIIVTVLLFFFVFIGQKRMIQRWQGLIFVGIYITYIAFSVYRG